MFLKGFFNIWTQIWTICPVLDRKLRNYAELKDVEVPAKGWIHSIKTAINMSQKQLGARLGITGQSVQEIAKNIVLKTSHNIMLEEQENSPERITKALEDRTRQIVDEIPRYLWD